MCAWFVFWELITVWFLLYIFTAFFFFGPINIFQTNNYGQQFKIIWRICGPGIDPGVTRKNGLPEQLHRPHLQSLTLLSLGASFKNAVPWGAWVPQPVKCPTSAHSGWVGAPHPALCWQLWAWSLLRILSLLLSLPLPCSHSVSFSLSETNKHWK